MKNAAEVSPKVAHNEHRKEMAMLLMCLRLSGACREVNESLHTPQFRLIIDAFWNEVKVLVAFAFKGWSRRHD